MPKIKTNRSAAKRFRATGGGKVRRHKAYASHMLSGFVSNSRNRAGSGSRPFFPPRTCNASVDSCRTVDPRAATPRRMTPAQ